MGYLPPFHSFGFTVNTILPLVAGLRLVNTPDPNDSLSVARLIAHTQPTLLATTPTFLRNLLNVASPDQLTSLRYVITGGEKCSESVFEKAKKLIQKRMVKKLTNELTFSDSLIKCIVQTVILPIQNLQHNISLLIDKKEHVATVLESEKFCKSTIIK